MQQQIGGKAVAFILQFTSECNSKRIIMQPSYRLHYVLPVCLIWARKSENKKCRKIKISVNVPRARVSRVPIFSWKGQRSRSLDVKNLKKLLLLDLIYRQCLRRLATGWTAAYHVSTRHRHLFLLKSVSYTYQSYLKNKTGWPQSRRKKSLTFPGFSRAINLLFHRLSQQKVNVIMTFIKGHSTSSPAI